MYDIAGSKGGLEIWTELIIFYILQFSTDNKLYFLIQPTVYTPLQWWEVKIGLGPSAFTIDTALERIKNRRYF